MGISFLQETYDGRNGEVTARKVGRFPRLVREYVRRWVVHTDSPADTQLQVLLNPAFPRILSPYVGTDQFVDLGSFCTGITASQDQDDPQTWKVQASYSSDLSGLAEMANLGDPHRLDGNNIGGQGSQGFENPLLRPPKVSWSVLRTTVQLRKDQNGKAFLNSAGDEFDPPPEVDFSRPVLTVVKNFAAFDMVQAVNYADCVNSDQWLSFGPGVVKVDSITAEFAFENNVPYWAVTASFHFARNDPNTPQPTWNPTQILDAGFSDISGKVFTDTYGHPYSKPKPLDGTGHQLAANAAPQYLSFTLYKARPFAALNMP